MVARRTIETNALPAADTSSALSLPANGGLDATGFPQTPTTDGSYAFRAPYSGDSNYPAKTGACEPLTVNNDTVVTVIHNAAHETVTSVPVNTTVHDQVTVTGTGVAPTGTVTFSWFTIGFSKPPAADIYSVSPLPAHPILDATGFPQTPTTDGSY